MDVAVWIVFVVVLVLVPSVYGWVFKGWGPPYRPFLARRRATGAVGGVPSNGVPPPGAAPGPEMDGWGAAGLVVTLAALAGFVWLVILVFM